MDQARKELILSRISSGTMRCKIGQEVYTLCPPDRESKYIANELYFKVYDDCLYEGMYFADEVFDLLLSHRLWDEDKQTRLEGLRKDVEELKLKLFQVPLTEGQERIAKGQIVNANSEINELENILHCLDYFTVEGVAQLAKQRFLIGSSIKKDGMPHIPKVDEPDHIVEAMIEHVVTNRVLESEFREIARTDPWNRMWSSCKNPKDAFGVSTIDLNDEQRYLITWSILYDNIAEHPEKPSDEVIDDDDKLDGWIIFQRNKRNVDDYRKRIMGRVSDKVANSDEIYIMPESLERQKSDEEILKELKLIEELNDPVAKMMKAKRMALLKKKGNVSEMEMPDTKDRFREAVHAKFKTDKGIK